MHTNCKIFRLLK